jgi:hypothetical protein
MEKRARLSKHCCFVKGQGASEFRKGMRWEGIK